MSAFKSRLHLGVAGAVDCIAGYDSADRDGEAAREREQQPINLDREACRMADAARHQNQNAAEQAAREASNTAANGNGEPVPSHAKSRWGAAEERVVAHQRERGQAG